MTDFRVIDGGRSTPPVDLAVRKRRRSDGILECPICKGREYITTSIGDMVIDGKVVVRAQRYKRCVICLSQGKLSELRRLSPLK